MGVERGPQTISTVSAEIVEDDNRINNAVKLFRKEIKLGRDPQHVGRIGEVQDGLMAEMDVA